MKIGVALASALALVCAAEHALAQPSPAKTNHTDGGFHLGIGGTVSPAVVFINDDFAVVPVAGGGLILPMDIAGVVRVEPFLQLAHFSSSRETPSGGEDEDAFRNITFGSGVFYIFGLGDAAQGYGGARLGANLAHVSDTDTNIDPTDGSEITQTTSVDRTDVLVSFNAGGEYFFSKHFSLGAEAGIRMTFLGNAETDVDPPAAITDTDDSGIAVSFENTIIARLFFF